MIDRAPRSSEEVGDRDLRCRADRKLYAVDDEGGEWCQAVLEGEDLAVGEHGLPHVHDDGTEERHVLGTRHRYGIGGRRVNLLACVEEAQDGKLIYSVVGIPRQHEDHTTDRLFLTEGRPKCLVVDGADEGVLCTKEGCRPDALVLHVSKGCRGSEGTADEQVVEQLPVNSNRWL